MGLLDDAEALRRKTAREKANPVPSRDRFERAVDLQTAEFCAAARQIGLEQLVRIGRKRGWMVRVPGAIGSIAIFDDGSWVAVGAYMPGLLPSRAEPYLAGSIEPHQFSMYTDDQLVEFVRRGMVEALAGPTRR